MSLRIDSSQPGILAAPPVVGCSMTFRPVPGGDLAGALGRLRDGFPPASGILGLGASVVRALGREVPRPVTGGYYWCPPVAGDRLDLRHLGL